LCIACAFLDSGDNSSREYLSLPNVKEKNREYIVTMGPLHPSSYVRIMTAKEATKMDTCAEFWKLCWMSGSRIIVMLCGVSPGFQVSMWRVLDFLYTLSDIMLLSP
jgi:hypothetical protein